MWWEPTNDFESALRADVDRLLGEYRGYLSTVSSQAEQRIYGVGSQIDENGQWRPVILVDTAAVEVGDTYLATELSLPWDDPVHRYLSSARKLAHVFDGSASLRALLGSWDVPDETLLLFSTRPLSATI